MSYSGATGPRLSKHARKKTQRRSFKKAEGIQHTRLSKCKRRPNGTPRKDAAQVEAAWKAVLAGVRTPPDPDPRPGCAPSR